LKGSLRKFSFASSFNSAIFQLFKKVSKLVKASLFELITFLILGMNDNQIMIKGNVYHVTKISMPIQKS
jgi:hypothetical protein